MAVTGSDNWTKDLHDLTPADKDHLVRLIQEHFQFLAEDFGYTSTGPETSFGHGVLITLSYRNEACGMTIECGFGNYQVLTVRFEKEGREDRNPLARTQHPERRTQKFKLPPARSPPRMAHLHR